jgi:hypothetical protein
MNCPQNLVYCTANYKKEKVKKSLSSNVIHYCQNLKEQNLILLS